MARKLLIAISRPGDEDTTQEVAVTARFKHSVAGVWFGFFIHRPVNDAPHLTWKVSHVRSGKGVGAVFLMPSELPATPSKLIAQARLLINNLVAQHGECPVAYKMRASGQLNDAGGLL